MSGIYCPVYFVRVCFVRVRFVRFILSGIFCPVYFVRSILSGIFCPGTFCPVYFVRYVLSGYVLSGIFCPGILCPGIFCPGLFCPGIICPSTVTLIPWKQGKCLAWDVTMPDTYAQSHLPTTATNVEHVADKSVISKTQNYQSILQSHLFTPIAIETAGVWNNQAREFIKELGKRITTVTGEIKETSYIFQQVSVAIQRCNMLSFIGSFTTDTD